jgi:DNA-directed RNA polymerase subunit E'/Rpb7
MAATGMFERRELTRVLPVHSKHLQRNIQSSLLSQIKAQVEGRCGVEGYVQPRSSVILEYSLGRMSILKSGVNYRVKFQADICLPHKGQQITNAPVMFRSKIGVHAEVSPLKILLPRDLHIGNEEFESIVENDTLDIEVLGAEFKQNDEEIFVLGKLIKRIPATTDEPPVPKLDAVPERILESTQESSGTKTITVAPVATEAQPEAKQRRRRKLATVPESLETSGILQLNVGSPSGPGETQVAPGVPESK